MTPEKTKYKIILVTEENYEKLEKLREKVGITYASYGSPVIVAERNNEFIGAVCREARISDRVVIGPLLAYNFIVYMRLVETLDKLLFSWGIEKYYFFVRRENKKVLDWMLSRGGEAVEIEKELSDGFWFYRKVRIS